MIHSKKMILWLVTLGLFTIVTLGCSIKPAQEEATDTDIARVKLTDLNGQVLQLKALQGKVVFINLWATWCGPCLQEMPSIERAQEMLKEKNIKFLLASNEEADRIQSFVKSRSLNSSYVRLENMEELAVPALPTTYVFNQEGKLVFSETGSRQWDSPENIEMLTKIINSHE
ncbi:hypothetical protein BH09BAC3_BH09BAC3_06710 [soil metagenome]